MLPRKLFGMRSAVLASDALKTVGASGCGISHDFRRERP